MLNISPSKLDKAFSTKNIPILSKIEAKVSGKVFLRLMIFSFFTFLVFMFLPWTQNIRAKGFVTTLFPDKRPQTIHSVIPGRIEKWYVREGDLVRPGDTILFISEVKDNYFDPDLLERTAAQLKAKEQSVASYSEKIRALETQVVALQETRNLKIRQADNKLQQAKLKIISDSMDYQASIINFNIAKEQLDRMEKLYKDGLKSLTDLENRKLTLQRTNADMVSKENALLTSQNELINAKVELISLRAQFDNSIAKAESDKFSAMSAMFDAETSVNKLRNELSNYSIRAGLYYVTSPIEGFITKMIQSGIGETIKEGEQIVSIMPYQFDFAVEMYVRPIDLPLVKLNQKVRIQFDGWPAIVFSGWPNTSYGTYGGRIFAIDNIISPDGTYRIIVAPDSNEESWPKALRVGAGSNSILLLQDVPVWYELWRQFNGFPPDYYGGDTYIYPEDRKKK
jgi:membrane fusion protein, adhesin transport system